MEEYLRASFPDLDCEYVDGEIVERSVPNYSHGKVQSNFSAFFVTLRKKNLPLFPGVETRLRVSPTRVCIPDVCVFSPEPAGYRFELPADRTTLSSACKTIANPVSGYVY